MWDARRTQTSAISFGTNQVLCLGRGGWIYPHSKRCKIPWAESFHAPVKTQVTTENHHVLKGDTSWICWFYIVILGFPGCSFRGFVKCWKETLLLIDKILRCLEIQGCIISPTGVESIIWCPFRSLAISTAALPLPKLRIRVEDMDVLVLRALQALGVWRGNVFILLGLKCFLKDATTPFFGNCHF